MDTTPTQLDPDALNLVKAIRHVESKDNFQAQGKSGEYGAYQFTNPTWDATSNKYGVHVPLQQATPEQQNEVAYKQIKEWKDKGHNIGEIASMWNAGVGRPDAYLENNVGTNKYGVHYDTPTYAKNVATTYQGLKSQNTQGFNPTPYSNPDNKPVNPGQLNLTGNEGAVTPPPADTSLGGELVGRTNDAGNAIKDTMAGKINPISGILQSLGAVGGAIGDVTNKALELIPGVKQVENLIGQGVGALAQTDTGKAVAQSIAEFSKAHPELSKDIGATFNIVTAIPILKGLGTVKNLAMDGISVALKDVAEKSMTKDLTEVLGRTVGGKKALQGTGDVVKTLIDERALPDIAGTKYTTQNAYEKLGQRITQIEEGELQPALASANVPETGSRIPLETYKQKAMADAVDTLKDPGPVEKYFERLKMKYGDYPTLQQMNEAKRLVAKNISEAGFASPTYSTDKIVRSALQQSVEDGAKALGLPDVAEINQRMGNLIKAQNVLKSIEGKPVKTGMIGGLVKNAATVGGEMVGEATGVPFAGTLIGRGVGGNIGKKLTGGVEGILKRTGKDAVKIPKEELKKKLGGLFGGVVSQKIMK